MLENEQNGLVNKRERGQVTSVCTGSFEDYAEFLAKSVIIVNFHDDSSGRMAGEKCCYIRSRSEEENHANGAASFST